MIEKISYLILIQLAISLNYEAHASTNSHSIPYISSGVDGSNDSDGFQEFKPWVKYESHKGWGIASGWQRYSMHNWSKTGRSLHITHHESNEIWSSFAKIGMNNIASNNHLIGSWDFNYKIKKITAIGFSAERNIVNSKLGIDRNLTFNTFFGTVEHQFSQDFSLGISGGSTWFSDNNRRDLLRTRWTYTLQEDSGWYIYATTRNYRNSEPYGGSYFAPARFRESAAGLMWKNSINNQLVVSINADAGRQYIDGLGQQLWHAGIFLRSPHNSPMQWKIGITTNKDRSSSINGSKNSYRYTSATASIIIPLH